MTIPSRPAAHAAPATHLDAPDDLFEARLAATRLRNLLRLNGEFSAITGLAAALAGGPVARLLGTDEVWLVRSIGVGLLGFAIGLFLLAGERTDLVRRLAGPISVADLLWVAGTAGVLALGLVSGTGAVILVAVAAVVLALGLAQLLARHRLTATTALVGAGADETPPVEVVVLRRSVPLSARQLWPVITDHGLYARLALNLRSAEALTPSGPGFVRRCTDAAGRTWSETCTLWEEGRRFDVDVDVSPADYPYPLQAMQGSWRVEPAGDGRSTVTMAFAFQPVEGLRGRLFAPAMHVVLRPVLARIARGWAHHASSADRGR